MNKLDRFMDGPMTDIVCGSLSFYPILLLFMPYFNNDWRIYGMWLASILIARIIRKAKE